MQLEAVRFKEEEMFGKYRAHFKLFINGTESGTRFGIEHDEKPTDEKLQKLVKERLKSMSIKFIKEEEFRAGINVN